MRDLILCSKPFTPASAHVQPRKPAFRCEESHSVGQCLAYLPFLEQLGKMHREQTRKGRVAAKASQDDAIPSRNLLQLPQSAIRRGRMHWLRPKLFLTQAFPQPHLIAYVKFDRDSQCLRHKRRVMTLFVGNQTLKDVGIS